METWTLEQAWQEYEKELAKLKAKYGSELSGRFGVKETDKARKKSGAVTTPQENNDKERLV